jgi:alpha-beta hydrolase superfamily lysophospholipase
VTERTYFEVHNGNQIAATLHAADAALTRVVGIAHGFKSSKIGPSRYFVDLARMLASRGVSTFRFDQPGSGDSEGSFEDSSFDAWVSSIQHFARRFAAAGSSVALLGQSMGALATMAATPRLAGALAGVVLWSAGLRDAGAPPPPEEGFMEEDGQRVRCAFWREAASIDFLPRYEQLRVPVYLVFGTADEYVTQHNIRSVEAARKEGDVVRVVEGLPHSAWPEPHRSTILRETADFLCARLA